MFCYRVAHLWRRIDYDTQLSLEPFRGELAFLSDLHLYYSSYEICPILQLTNFSRILAIFVCLQLGSVIVTFSFNFLVWSVLGFCRFLTKGHDLTCSFPLKKFPKEILCFLGRVLAFLLWRCAIWRMFYIVFRLVTLTAKAFKTNWAELTLSWKRVKTETLRL